MPLAYDALDYVAPFASEKVPEGLVAVVRNASGQGTLRVLTLERLAERFTQRTLRLAFTPRRLLVHEGFRTLITAEADKGALPYAAREDLPVRFLSAGTHAYMCVNQPIPPVRHAFARVVVRKKYFVCCARTRTMLVRLLLPGEAAAAPGTSPCSGVRTAGSAPDQCGRGRP